MSADWRTNTPQAEAEGLIRDQVDNFLADAGLVDELMEQEGYDLEYAQRVAEFMVHAEITITFPSAAEIETIIADGR